MEYPTCALLAIGLAEIGFPLCPFCPYNALAFRFDGLELFGIRCMWYRCGLMVATKKYWASGPRFSTYR